MLTRVLVAEEHLIVRDSLRRLLAQEEDFEVIGATGSGRDAVNLVESLSPHVVLLDIDLPELHAVEAIKAIITAHPSIKIVVLSLHAKARFVEESLHAGASAYAGPDCDFTQFVAAIRAVMAGQTYLSPAVTKVVVTKYLDRSMHPTTGPFAALTDRQREVLQLLTEGRSTKAIAVALHRSSKTLETHRQQIMQILNLHTVAELTKYAIREGLTRLEQ